MPLSRQQTTTALTHPTPRLLLLPPGRFTPLPWPTLLAARVPELHAEGVGLVADQAREQRVWNGGGVKKAGCGCREQLTLPTQNACTHTRTQIDAGADAPHRPHAASPSPLLPPLTPTPQSQVWELMNLAYGRHEITSDFATAAWLWFESG